MNDLVTVALVTVGILAVVGLTITLLVIVGIHSEERRMNLSAQPVTNAEALARWVTGIRVSQPDACRIFRERHAVIAARTSAQRSAARRGARLARYPSQ